MFWSPYCLGGGLEINYLNVIAFFLKVIYALIYFTKYNYKLLVIWISKSWKHSSHIKGLRLIPSFLTQELRFLSSLNMALLDALSNIL